VLQIHVDAPGYHTNIINKNAEFDAELADMPLDNDIYHIHPAGMVPDPKRVPL
jgi:hypothetical protein